MHCLHFKNWLLLLLAVCMSWLFLLFRLIYNCLDYSNAGLRSISTLFLYLAFFAPNYDNWIVPVSFSEFRIFMTRALSYGFSWAVICFHFFDRSSLLFCFSALFPFSIAKAMPDFSFFPFCWRNFQCGHPSCCITPVFIRETVVSQSAHWIWNELTLGYY